MKKTITPLLFLLLSAFALSAQNWQQTYPADLPASEAIYNIAVRAKDTLWLLGGPNVALKSTNGGVSWEPKQPMAPPAGAVWSKAFFINSSEGYLAGNSGVIAKTIDGGNSWTLKTYGTNSFFSVFFINKDMGWVIGNSGTIYKTSDAGQSWVAQSSGVTTSLHDLWFSDKDTGFIVGASGTLLKTVNGGTTWQASTISGAGHLTSVSFINKDTGWAAGNSRICVTYNKGANWQVQSSKPVTNILFLNKDTGFYTYSNVIMKTNTGGASWDTLCKFTRNSRADGIGRLGNTIYAGNGNTLIRSLNNGNKWDTVYNLPVTNYNLWTGSMIDAKTGWAIGMDGVVLKTQDSALTWTSQNSGTRKMLSAVAILNKDTAWIAGPSIILKTVNGGLTWDSISNADGIDVQCIKFLNRDTGFFGGSGNYLYRTVNGGTSWTSISRIGGVINDIYFLNADTGYTCGTTGLTRTINRGLTWTPVTTPISSNLGRIRFSGNYGLVYSKTSSTSWLYTSNRGATWATKTSSVYSVYGMEMISPDVIVGLYSLTGLLKSTDSTNSWQDLGAPRNLNGYGGILYADSSFIIAVGNQKVIRGTGNWLLFPVLDSISADSFSNTDSVSFIAYGKNFDQYTSPVALSNATATVNLISPTRLQVSYKRTSKFPVGYYTFSITNYGEKAGRTSGIRFTVHDTLPLTPSWNILSSGRDSARMALAWTKGSGTNRIVIMRKNAPVNVFPLNDSAGYTAAAFGSGSHLGDGNYVVSKGAATTLALLNLEPNTEYHYAIIEYTRTTAPVNYNNHVYATGSFRTSNVYYNPGSGPLNKLSFWNTKRDGSGVSPQNFTDSFTYYLPNFNPSPVIDSSWNVSGYKAYVIFGNGTDPLNYYIAPGVTVNIDSIRVKANITVTNDGEFLFRKSSFDAFSLVQFVSSAPQQIASASYYDMTVTGSEKTLNGNTTISNIFNMIGDVNCNGYTLNLSLNPSSGNPLNYLDGIIRGRFSRNISPTPTLYPIGIANEYRPVTITGPFQNSIAVSFVDTFINNAGLPQFDASLTPLVRINKAAKTGLWRVETLSSVSYGLAVTATNFPGISDSSKLRLIKRNIGGTWTIPGTAQTVSGTAAAPVVGRTGLTGPGEYGIGSDSTINSLPVKLLSFEGTRTGSTNKLSWATASEINNKGFYVYRSTNLKNWEEIDFVTGNGTVSNASVYEYSDQVSGSETYYYFLRQVDFNGTSDQSAIVVIQASEEQALLNVIYPNPASGNTLSVKSSLLFPALISIYSPASVLQQSLSVESEKDLHSIDIKNLSPGLYYLQVKDQAQLNNYKFIKE